MSIRLRLTLLYTAILALTLTGFGGVLYGTQSRSLLAGEQEMLTQIARRIVEHRTDGRQFAERPFPPLSSRDDDSQNRRFGTPTVYLQLLSPEGQVISHSENLEEVDLPLSDTGLQAARDGESWMETASVENEQLLIYSTPVTVEGQITEVVQIARSLADRDQYLSTLRGSLLAGSGVAVLVAFGAGWLLSGAALRPVNRITQTAGAIGAGRDFGRRVDYAGPSDEVGQLATTFNTMLAELNAAYQEVRQSLQQQRRFVADVSHELRTPLTTIRGNLALLRRDPPVSVEEREDIVSDTVDESDRLIRLVSDLLTLAHAEAGRLLRSEPIRLRPLVEDVCRQAKLLEPDRTITCVPLRDVAVIGDPDALKQVLLILLDNAVNHASGPITVATAAAEGRASITVRDSGPGIDLDTLPHVFERFYRGHEAQGKPGVGLGLSIAKALVEAQNGTITVASQVDLGCIVTLTLPLA